MLSGLVLVARIPPDHLSVDTLTEASALSSLLTLSQASQLASYILMTVHSLSPVSTHRSDWGYTKRTTMYEAIAKNNAYLTPRKYFEYRPAPVERPTSQEDE